MILKNLSLTNAYQAIPVVIRNATQILSADANTGNVSLALSASPSASDVIIITAGSAITLDGDRNDGTQLYAKSSVASGDVLYMIQN